MSQFSEIEYQRMSVCVLTDQSELAQQRLSEMRAVLPENRLNLSYRCEPGIAQRDASNQFDIGVITFENLVDTNKCLALSQCAASSCRFTIAYIPVVANTPDTDADAVLLLLYKIERLVDTVVLVPGKRQYMSEDVVTMVPALLSGSSFIGIDYADIRHVLTANKTVRSVKPGVCIVDTEFYTGSQDLLDSAEKLGRRMSSIPPTRYESCLVSIPMTGKDVSLKLHDLVTTAEVLHGAICPADSPLVFGAPVVGTENSGNGCLNMVCVAGHTKVSLEWLDSLLQ